MDGDHTLHWSRTGLQAVMLVISPVSSDEDRPRTRRQTTLTEGCERVWRAHKRRALVGTPAARLCQGYQAYLTCLLRASNKKPRSSKAAHSSAWPAEAASCSGVLSCRWVTQASGTTKGEIDKSLRHNSERAHQSVVFTFVHRMSEIGTMDSRWQEAIKHNNQKQPPIQYVRAY